MAVIRKSVETAWPVFLFTAPMLVLIYSVRRLRQRKSAWVCALISLFFAMAVFAFLSGVTVCWALRDGLCWDGRNCDFSSGTKAVLRTSEGFPIVTFITALFGIPGWLILLFSRNRP